MKLSVGSVAALVACIVWSGSFAGELRITPAKGCGQSIALNARQVPLSIVLRQLSAAEGFALTLDPSRDPPVDLELRLPLDKLLKKLTRTQNLVLEEVADPQCPGLRRVVKVVLLPEGRMLAPPPPPPPAPETAEQKESLARYRRAHGMDENGQHIRR